MFAFLSRVKFINQRLFSNIMIITISGNPGSGKSTVAEILVKKLEAKRIYVGGIRRELAREKGMTLQELNEYAKNNPETDVDIDKKAATEAKGLHEQGKLVVVEGRTQYHFIPESVKVYMKVDSETGAKRIWKDLQDKQASQQRNEGNLNSLEEVKKRVLDRESEDAQRYLKYYDIDPRVESQYDLIVDTTNISAEEAAQKVIDYVKNS